MELAEMAPIAKNIKNLISFLLDRKNGTDAFMDMANITPPLKNNLYLNKGAVIRSSSSE